MRDGFRLNRTIHRVIVISLALGLLLTVDNLSRLGEAKGISPSSLPLCKADCPDAMFLPDEIGQTRPRANLNHIPLSFEVNRGQTANSVQFLSRGSGYTLFLNQNRAVFPLQKRTMAPVTRSNPDVLTLELLGSNSAAQGEALNQQPGKHNYFIGNDPAKWRVDVPTFEKVNFREVYNGVDLVYYGNQRELEYDFIVTANADPAQIRWGVSSKSKVRIDSDGQLIVQTNGSEVMMKKPVAYQTINGERRGVAADYVLSHRSKTTHVGFSLGEYDRSTTLVIDPVVVFSSSLLDGSGTDSANSITVDASGNTYVTGHTASANFPTVNPIQAALSGGQDAFVSKFNAAGTALVYSTFLGGNTGFENGWDIAADAAGNMFITGQTIAPDFPTTASARQPTRLTGNSQDTAFVTRLSPTGTLFYSTYLSGTQSSQGFGIGTDGAGNAYVTGRASSLGFPLTASAFSSTSATTGFLTKLNTNASGAASLVYSSYLGPTGFAEGRSIAVEANGNVYITGNAGSTSTNFTSTGAFQTTYGGGSQDAFIAKFNTNLSGAASRVYSTYVGGSNQDFGGNATSRGSKAIAVDRAGNAYITGQTNSTNFPTANAFQSTFGGTTDAFLTKLNASGTALVYSTYLGGGGTLGEQGRSVAVNVVGNAYVTGIADANFPLLAPLSTADGTTGGAFLTKFSPAGNTLVYSTRFGQAGDQGLAVALDGAGNAFVSTIRASATFITEIADPTIIGRVIDEDGSPIFGAIVNLTGAPGGTVVTDNDGFFSFGLLTVTNNYSVAVSVPNYIFLAQTSNNLAKNVRLDFSPVVFTVSGQVTSCAAALGGATIALTDGKSLTRTTDGSGNYSFASLPAGRNYTITPSLAGFIFSPVAVSITNLSANQTVSFTARPPMASVAGRVTTPSGQNLRSATVTLIDPQGVRTTTTTSSFGLYSFTGVPTGQSYTLTVGSKRYRFAPQILPLECNLANVDLVGLE